ncbi:hypothetical protein TNCV_888821 [Trichonephila clavipes]|nr:hypothetical protein TNCV_888821 [Trichonephila clavipes]
MIIVVNLMMRRVARRFVVLMAISVVVAIKTTKKNGVVTGERHVLSMSQALVSVEVQFSYLQFLCSFTWSQFLYGFLGTSYKKRRNCQKINIPDGDGVTQSDN